MPAVSGSLNFSILALANNCYGGDEITFEFISEYQPTSTNWTGSFSLGSLVMDIQPTSVGGYPYATSSADYGDFIYAVQSPNIILLNSSLSSFVDRYQQIPIYRITSDTTPEFENSLYTRYGDINYPFQPVANDKIVLRSTTGRTQIVTIQNISNNGNNLQITVNPNLNLDFLDNPDLLSELLIVKKLENEQNVILPFNITYGYTSFGFLIPEDINLDVLNSISTIQSNVQNQLIST
jgi:hypothetical protein